MQLSKSQIGQLLKAIEIVQTILVEASKEPLQKKRAQSGASQREIRTRRSGKELAAFRKMLRAERKSGVPVADIAKRHNVSKTYVYQI